jgi:ABC-type multidrug transport system permease subunit
MYIKNRESKLLKYIFSISFSVLYTYVLLTAAVPTTFVYVFMLFVAIIPYGDMILCYITGGVAVVANIVSIVLGFMNKSLTTDDLAMVEIQLAAIILGAVFVGFATYTIGKINAQKLEEINDEKKKVSSNRNLIRNISSGRLNGRGLSGKIYAILKGVGGSLVPVMLME